MMQAMGFPYGSKINQLNENDFDAALSLLIEIVGKINDIFDTQLKTFADASEKIQRAQEVKGDQTKVCRPKSELEKDRIALDTAKQKVEKWQNKYAVYIEGFPKFVTFMKEQHPQVRATENAAKEIGLRLNQEEHEKVEELQDSMQACHDFYKNFTAELAVHYKAYSRFDQQMEEFFKHYQQANRAEEENKEIIGIKLSGWPVNQETYTQEIATSIAVKQAFDALAKIQGLLCSMFDVTSKAYAWLQAEKTCD